jgi:hypothetical protein
MTVHFTDISRVTEIPLFSGPVKALNAVHEAGAVLTFVNDRTSASGMF